MNIVVRAPNWIGDCIMCLPALRALKRRRPDAHIHVVARNYLLDVFKNVPQIRSVIPIPNTLSLKQTFSTAAELRGHGFKHGVLFTNSFHSALLFRLAGINRLTGYDKDMRGFLLSQKIPYALPPNQHHIHFYLNLVELFLGDVPVAALPAPDPMMGGQQQSQYWEPLPVTADEIAHLRALSFAHPIDWDAPLIGFSPSAAYGTAKQWLPHRFGQLMAQVLNALPRSQVFIFGSAGEAQKIAAIVAAIPRLQTLKHRIHNLAGRLSLCESITGISLCNAFVANDSGLMHVAAALQVPVIGLFGPTQPGNTSPAADENTPIVIIQHPTPCAPCKHRDCPIHHPCMEAITVAEVFKHIMDIYRPNPNNINRPHEPAPGLDEGLTMKG